MIQAQVRSLEGSHTSEALKRLHQALSSGAYRRDRTERIMAGSGSCMKAK